jgi:GxxExxY protein
MRRRELIEEDLTYAVIGAFYEVYNELGYGFAERIYMDALELELRARGRGVRREVPIQVIFKGKVLARQRLDMVVDDKLVVEGKSTFDVHKSALRKVYNYLHATRLEVGLLLHFGPEARFYRLISSNKREDPTLTKGESVTSVRSVTPFHPPDPLDPPNPMRPMTSSDLADRADQADQEPRSSCS